jgi:hypothetical protein
MAIYGKHRLFASWLGLEMEAWRQTSASLHVLLIEKAPTFSDK